MGCCRAVQCHWCLAGYAGLDHRLGAAVTVALISLFLMADYWVRPAGVFLEFRARGGTIAGEVGGKASNALAFARQVEDEQRRLGPSRVSTPFRKYPSG